MVTRCSQTLVAVEGLYLSPYGNFAEVKQFVVVRRPTIVFDGPVNHGSPGVTQTLILNRSAFRFGLGVVR